MTTWNDRVVVITGAGGLGSAMARWYADPGPSVALIDRAPGPLEAFADALRGEPTAGAQVGRHVADVSDGHHVAGAFDAIRNGWGRVDVLVNNAGITDDTDLVDTTPQRWESSTALCFAARTRTAEPSSRACATGARA